MPGLLYGVVVKHRVKGWVVAVTTRLVYGTWAAVWQRLAASPVSQGLNTSFVERMNLTLRQGSRRLTRKSNGFSKKREWLRYQLEVAIAYYHFVRPQGGLR
jgi:IS1 family transposase